MKKNVMRYKFGWIILITHFSSIVLYGALGLLLLGNITDVTGLVLSITPLTALYLMAFLRYVVKDTGQSDGVEIPLPAYRVQLAFILFFCFLLLPVGGALFYSGVIKYSNMSVFIGLIETLFAGYMATIFYSLFPESAPKNSGN
ncbi:MAG: hypothetical protein WA790_02610 [Sulfitobacter sp.]